MERHIQNFLLSCFFSIMFWVALGHEVMQGHFCQDQLLKDWYSKVPTEHLKYKFACYSAVLPGMD